MLKLAFAAVKDRDDQLVYYHPGVGTMAPLIYAASCAKCSDDGHPSKINRKVPIPHDRQLYRQRHRIENMFGRLKDWRRIHPSAAFQRCFASSEPFGCSARYNRCAHTFMSAIGIAATVIFWL